jgi:membrane associated rhomboid family serine protease
MYATYQLENLYLINIIELSNIYTFDYERYLTYRELTMKQFSDVGAEKVYLLNLLLIENPDMIYKDVNYDQEKDDCFIDAHWIIDTTYHELVIPRRQMKHLLGLEYSISSTIAQQDLPNYKMHEKNKTAYLSAFINISILAIFILMEFVGGSFTTEGFIKFGGIQGDVIFSGGELWRIFTYGFVHVNVVHLLINTFYIFYFGTKLERFLKGWEFFSIVLGSGIFAGLFASVISIIRGDLAMTIGAGGMVYGIIGGTILYSKLTKKSLDNLNDYGILILFLIGIAFSISNDILNTALNIGGFIGGILVTLVIARNYKHQNQSEIQEDIEMVENQEDK